MIEEVLMKVKRLRRKPDYSVRTALVYCGKLSKQVEAEGYFDKIVDAKDRLFCCCGCQKTNMLKVGGWRECRCSQC